MTLWATTGSDVEGAASDGVGLEIDEVNAAMATLGDGGATWVGKLSSTVISGGNDVQVATSGDGPDRCRGAGRLLRAARSTVGS